MTKEYTTVDRIIAKIDNDFNPNNSDWIPRVGAWINDALMQLDCVPTEKVRKTIIIKDRIGISPCSLGENIKVFDENGCELIELDKLNNSCCENKSNHSFKGDIEITPQTIIAENVSDEVDGSSIAFQENVPIPYPPRYNVINLKNSCNKKRGYVRIDNSRFELNFDTNCIIVEYNAPKQIKCNYYNCVAPMIPNNGKLIEAITYYCIYKMLTRGYVHPVMNLAASQYGTNPYYIWTVTKDEAKRSVINDGTDEILDDLWRSAFYIQTFNPRGKK